MRSSILRPRCTVLTVVMSLATISTAERLKFDYGWRFQLAAAPPSPPCNVSAFQPTVGQCRGLSAVPTANTSDECRTACCNTVTPFCEAWQWQVIANNKSSPSRCWVGQCQSPPNGKNTEWAGGIRRSPSPTPPAPATHGPASPEYDDSGWAVVDVPHDYLISLPYSPDNAFKNGFLPRADGFYRKHFRLPDEWVARATTPSSTAASTSSSNSSMWLDFEGCYKACTVWLNGVQLTQYGDSSAAYTSFTVPLDAAHGLKLDSENVIAVYIDGSYGTEHWYVGAGLYRHVWLVSAPSVHLAEESIFAPTFTAKPYTTAVVAPSVRVTNGGETPAVATIHGSSLGVVTVVVVSPKDIVVGHSNAELSEIAAGATVTVVLPNITVDSPKLWSVKTPTLYTVVTTLTTGAGGTDVRNTTIGIRDLTFTHAGGLFVNGDHVKIRGMCDHNDFTAVGMAVSERINLYRVQSLRGIGGNGWRMSHNPYRDTLYDTMDRLGVLVWDETRDLREPQLPAMGQMIREHRNHPSIMVWSFCNEGGCGAGSNHTLAQEFRDVAYEWDGTRPVSGNMRSEIGPGTLSDSIDIQGLSHPSPIVLDRAWDMIGQKALIASECCSCQTMRGENHANATIPTPSNFNADCLSDQVNRSDDGRPFVIGSMVWTLFDYYGEPYKHTWPHVTSSYGSFDVAGFPKAAVWWYRSLWLDGIDAADAGRPPLAVRHTVKIVQDNERESREIDQNGSVKSTIQVYSSTPKVELFVNGRSMGVVNRPRYMWAEWDSLSYEAGNLTAVGLSVTGDVLAVDTVLTAKRAVSLVLTIDVPSAVTGTGSKLVLDGQDTALLRATVVDADGHIVPLARNNVTFSIISGPGRVLGVGNGDPTNHEPNQATWRSAFHGLVRGVIQVTVDAASPADVRRQLLQMDSDTQQRTTIWNPEAKTSPPSTIVVQASSPGLQSTTVTIDVSTDATTDGVLAVAARSVGLANTAA